MVDVKPPRLKTSLPLDCSPTGVLGSLCWTELGRCQLALLPFILRALQNAVCVPLFPVPLPKPGFFSTSMTSFSSCVPASACPGVDAQLVSASYSALLLGGPNELRQVGHRGWVRCPLCPIIHRV